MSVSSPLREEFIGSYARRHGCAWFEPDSQGRRDPNVASGWWAVGGEPAQRFSSWRDLPDRVTWWTNLGRAESWALGRWSSFKEGGLFGPDWPGLMTDSGHGASDDEVAAAVSAWSEIFARCAEWLAEWASVHDPENPWDWGEGNLADVLAPKLGWVASEPEDLQPILQVAYQEVVDQEMPSNLLAGRRRVVLAFPRIEHIQKIWSTRFPKGKWTPIKEWPRLPEDRLAWVRGQDRPVLARVVSMAWRAGQESPGMLWMGLRGRRFPASEVEPLWLTGEEAAMLGTFAELTMDEGFLGQGWDTLEMPPGWPLSADEPLIGLSWSQALLSVSAWNAAASPTRDPSRRRRSWFTSRAVWWRAADRARCFRSAWQLQKDGWTVLRYGQGQVVLLIDPADAVPPLADAIARAGLLMPALISKLAPITAQASHQDTVQVDRWLKQTGDALALLDIDRLVAPWAGSAAEVRGVLEPAAQRLMGLSPVPNAEWRTWWDAALRKQARRSVDKLKEQAKRNK